MPSILYAIIPIFLPQTKGNSNFKGGRDSELTQKLRFTLFSSFYPQFKH